MIGTYDIRSKIIGPYIYIFSRQEHIHSSGFDCRAVRPLGRREEMRRAGQQNKVDAKENVRQQDAPAPVSAPAALAAGVASLSLSHLFSLLVRADQQAADRQVSGCREEDAARSQAPKAAATGDGEGSQRSDAHR